MTICGIDPGKKGAIAYIGTDCIEVLPLPYDETIDIQVVVDFIRKHKPDVIRIEKPSFRGGQNAASVAGPNLNYGMMLGAFRVLGYAVDTVHSITWTTEAGVKVSAPKGTTPARKQKMVKDRHIQRAKELFPTVEIGDSDGIADALLIAWTGAK